MPCIERFSDFCRREGVESVLLVREEKKWEVKETR
jgi:hypothetical protein